MNIPVNYKGGFEHQIENISGAHDLTLKVTIGLDVLTPEVLYAVKCFLQDITDLTNEFEELMNHDWPIDKE